MAATRKKTNPGDYQLEQMEQTKSLEYQEYLHAANGEPIQSFYAGNGILMGRMAPTTLSYNSCDIESQLFGIGSCNLVAQKSPVMLDAKSLNSLDMASTKLPLYIPTPLVVEPGHRY